MQKNLGSKAAQAAETRERLIDVARRLFADRGYENTSLDDVLVEVQLTKGAIYHHFRNKKDLFRAVVVTVQRQVADAADHAGRTQSDPIRALEAVCSAFFHELQKPEAMRIACRDAGAFLTWSECAAIDEAHMFAVLRRFVGAARQAQAWPDLDLDATIRVVTGAIYQTVEWASHGETRQRMAAGEAVLLELLRGVSKP